MKPDFEKMNGLVPAVVQDVKTKQVLMLAYVNEEAYEKMLETGDTWFYSRSRNKLWHKGEESGHFQHIKGLYLDCDLDTIVIYVEQVGAACHTGSYSCFFNEVIPYDNSDFAHELYDLIEDRKVHPVEKSYTKDPNSDYIKYTLTVSAGPDGSQNVYVVDKFTTNKNLVTYAGDISHTPTELGTTEDGQKPYETRNTDIAGQIYLTNQPNSDKEIPESVTDSTKINKPGSIVWAVDQLAPNETRTLIYYVKLTDKQDIRNKDITNKASVLNKKGNETYLKGSSEKTFTPSINYGMTKNIISTNGKQYTKDQDGNYIVQYRLNFTLNANSNYPLKNYAFFDYLNYSGFANDNKMLPYISYMQNSIELHQIVGSTDTIIDSSLYKVQWETNGTN